MEIGCDKIARMSDSVSIWGGQQARNCSSKLVAPRHISLAECGVMPRTATV